MRVKCTLKDGDSKPAIIDSAPFEVHAVVKTICSISSSSSITTIADCALLPSEVNLDTELLAITPLLALLSS